MVEKVQFMVRFGKRGVRIEIGQQFIVIYLQIIISMACIPKV